MSEKCLGRPERIQEAALRRVDRRNNLKLVSIEKTPG
jgi:hypothetical protein